MKTPIPTPTPFWKLAAKLTIELLKPANFWETFSSKAKNTLHNAKEVALGLLALLCFCICVFQLITLPVWIVLLGLKECWVNPQRIEDLFAKMAARKAANSKKPSFNKR